MNFNLNFRPIQRNIKNGLIEVAPNIWTIEAKECICYRPPMQPRYPYTYRAIVIRLKNNSLFVLSPTPLTPELRTDIDRLGNVKFIVSPNHIHHLHMGDWSKAYPEAFLYASPRLPPKRKDLNFHKTLKSNILEPEWADEIDWCIFGTSQGLLDEIVFFHPSSGTVIFTDLIMDFDPANFNNLSKVTTRWNQMYKHTPLGIQLAHIFDRAALRAALNTVYHWQPERIIIAHSPWLCLEGKEEVKKFLEKAFDWLNPVPIIIETVMSLIRFIAVFLVILPIHFLIVLFADIIYPKVKKNLSKYFVI